MNQTEEELDPSTELLQLADLDTLCAAARGEIDLNRVAVQELANRGMDPQGKWVGFDVAKASVPEWERRLPSGSPSAEPRRSTIPGKRPAGPSR